MKQGPAGYFNFDDEIGIFWSRITLSRYEDFQRFGAPNMLRNFYHAVELETTMTH
jgi:hypothetical protein